MVDDKPRKRARRGVDKSSRPTKVVKDTDEMDREDDLANYLDMKQSDAAGMLGVPTSTLSKLWNHLGRGAKWPHRSVLKIDVEIQRAMEEVDDECETMPPWIEARVTGLLQERLKLLEGKFPIRVHQWFERGEKRTRLSAIKRALDDDAHFPSDYSGDADGLCQFDGE